jgi:hypothetical protein
MRLVLPFLTLAVFAGAAAAAEQTVTLSDGRKLTGVYDEEAGTITLSGPAKAVIRIAKAEVVSIEQSKAAAGAGAIAAPSAEERRKASPLAALDALIAQKEHDQDEAETNAKDATRKAAEETAAGAKAESAERKKQYSDRAAQLGLSSQRHTAEAQRLEKELVDLKAKRADLAKRQLADEARNAAARAVESFNAAAPGDGNPLLTQYRTAEDETRERRTRLAQATAELKDAEAAQAKLATQLDQAMVLSLDLRDCPAQDQPGESASDRDRRLAAVKAYNAVMATLRAAKTDLQAGKDAPVHASLELLRPEPMRRVHRDKTGRALVLWDEAAKALEGGK